jgi:hypothetical protein
MVAISAFPRMLIGLMTTDQAACSRAKHSVMTSVVSCDPTDNSTLYAAGSRRRSRTQRDRSYHQS